VIVAILYVVAWNSQYVKAQALDPGYEAATPYTNVSYCEGGPGDGRTYCRRNCTSYVAYKLQQAGVSSNSYQHLGNGKDWVSTAGSRGIAKGITPKLGAVAYWTVGGGGYGHVGWVEAINSNGSVRTSNYNGLTEAYYEQAEAWPEGYIYFSNVKSGSSLNAQFIGTNTLSAGKRLNAGQYILSNNAQYALVMQGDGNLVLYGSGMRAIWSSGTSGKGATYAVMQTDGNFVLYTSSNKAVWHTYTAGKGSSRAIIQDDGNFVVYAGNVATWNTRTGGKASYSYFGASRLNAGQILNKGQYIRSPDKRYVALMQTDGNLVVYGPAYEVFWNARTGGNVGARLVMQGDGNLVIYIGSKALWNTQTAGKGSSYLEMQNDTNLVTYTAQNTATWSYKTGRTY